MMKKENKKSPMVISSSSKKLQCFVEGLKKQKLAQQEKLANMKECTFVVNL